MSRVKLAIRVRPLTEKELKSEKNDALVVNVVDQNTITITNVKVSLSGAGDSRERVRVYNADYTFDSSCPATSPNYASQEKVFNTIGSQVLTSISSGVSACVLAYGQSATGKTFTMMGTDSQPGLIPRLCLALSELPSMEISVSYLEIYNERVHDLLASEVLPCNSLPRRKGNLRKDLRVREHPNRGPYVQTSTMLIDLRRVLVRDVRSLLSVVGEGSGRRRTAATRRNSASSRSHALLELVTPAAALQLVDLAGSEKAAHEGYGGCRQKEGANINKSLVALSNVISALVSGGGPGRFVPYRDSALTWLLKDCFTGGANTFIIATLSPSVACYGESASTLRWAARTRQLPPRTHKTPNLITKAALHAQYNTLLRELQKHFIRYVPETGTLSFDESHWTLNKDSPANIGNIMNFLRADTKDPNIDSPSREMTRENQEEIAKEISNEIDKIFGSTLERTRSSGDFEIVPPIRNKRRQYRSQEVLSSNKPQQQAQKQNTSEISQSLSEERLDEVKNHKSKTIIPTSILYDGSQRAEIVESVTERLYSKLKKSEEAVAKMDAIMDKKIVQPLNELKICTNARQRLMEISQKALRNKRKIGIPAYTQTKKFIVRVKDQEIDVQTELLPYESNKNQSSKLQRDVGTETISITPRYKEIGIGSEQGTLSSRNSSTMTSNTGKIKSTSTMTAMPKQAERSTQTSLLPPPRRKRPSKLFSRYMKILQSTKAIGTTTQPIININISSTCNEDTDSHSSDVSSQSNYEQNNETKLIPPDLLTDHSAFSDKQIDDQIKNNSKKSQKDSNIENKLVEKCILNQVDAKTEQNINEDFPDVDDYLLPRVSVDSVKTGNPLEMKNMILGRNSNVYPYNISVSPMHERNENKRTIRFADNYIRPHYFESDEDLSIDLECASLKCFENYKETDTNSSDFTNSDATNYSSLDEFKTKLPRKNLSNVKNGHALVNHYKADDTWTNKTKRRLSNNSLGLERDDEHESCSNSSLDFVKPGNRTYLENFHNRKYNLPEPHREKQYSFDEIDGEIRDSCKKLEYAVNKYEKYLCNYKKKGQSTERLIKSPAKFLRHLIEIRKNIVREDQQVSSNTDESSCCKNK